MNSILCLFAILADRQEENGWYQLLIFVVMAVIWALGGLAKTKKQGEKEESKKIQYKPKTQKNTLNNQLLDNTTTRKIKIPKYQFASQKQRKKYVYPDRVALQAEKDILSKEAKIKSDSEHLSPSVAKSNLKKYLSTHKDSNSSDLSMKQSLEQHQAVDWGSEDIYLDLTSSLREQDSLKKAIIYSEILGRPLSLRGSIQQEF